MRMPLLPADFIHARGCKPICAKLLTLPTMAKQKKPVHRVEMTEGKRNIIRQLLEEYDIETAEDIQDRFVAFSTVNP